MQNQVPNLYLFRPPNCPAIGVHFTRTGQEFLHGILEQGGTREAMELFVAFRGREPRIDALLRQTGLLARTFHKGGCVII